jgi:tRNA G18 (ribose-2'-O)-methylase SpoU
VKFVDIVKEKRNSITIQTSPTALHFFQMRTIIEKNLRENTMAHIVEITDWDAPELDIYARLTEAQLRNKRHPEKGIFIAESAKVIAHGLDAGYVPVSFLMDRKQITGQELLLDRCDDVPVYTADSQLLERLTGYRLTRSILCAMKRKENPSIEEICRGARRLAVLENIVDPTNVGAIFRSAAALHMDGVLVTPSCCDPLHRRAVRVSMGTVFQVPWTVIGQTAKDWPEKGLRQLHSLGFATAAMALSDRAISVDALELMAEPQLALVLGTEGEGLSGDTIAQCDYTVCIPMAHGVDSLNVAAASAVAFWQLGNRK